LLPEQRIFFPSLGLWNKLHGSRVTGFDGI
jgi:hypothetical protein